jgi:hypothetical protein
MLRGIITIQRGPMKRVYFLVVYVVLTVAALVLASGAPVSFSGTGGGG